MSSRYVESLAARCAICSSTARVGHFIKPSLSALRNPRIPNNRQILADEATAELRKTLGQNRINPHHA